MEGPSGLAWVGVVVVVLLFLPYVSVVLLAFPAPVIYIAAALIPSALLLSSCSAHQTSAAGSQDDEHDVSVAADQSSGQQQASNANADAARRTGVSKRRSLRGDTQGSSDGLEEHEAQPQAYAPAALLKGVLGHAGMLHCSAVTGPPCAGNCSSSSCPWHLPMAPSLRLWGQDSVADGSSNSKRRSGGGKRPNSTNNLQDGLVLQKQPVAAEAFSFSFSSSTAHASTGESTSLPAAVGLFRSFSAPAAPDMFHTAAVLHGASALEGFDFDGAAAQQHWTSPVSSIAAQHEPGVVELNLMHQQQQPQSAQLPFGSTDVLELSLIHQQQPQSAQQQCSSTVPDSPGPFWVSSMASAAAAPSANTDAPQQVQAAMQQAQAAAATPAAATTTTAVADAGQGSCQAPGPAAASRHLLHVQTSTCAQQTELDMCGEEPCTPLAAARQSEMLAVLDCAWAGTQTYLQAPEQQQLLAHPPRTPPDQQQQQQELQALEHQLLLAHSPHTHPDQQQQHGRGATGYVAPLPFIATTTRHGMCMRHPSNKHHHTGGSPLSLSSGGVVAWAQPLPSPAESPLARRLSDRNDFGLPAASPALTELLSSGGGSRQQLRREGGGVVAWAQTLPSPAESPLARRLSDRNDFELPAASPALTELLSSGGCNRRQLRRDFLSLDTSRRSVSSPGSNRSSVELQQQHQEHEQGVPWAGMQLRSVAHLLQQRALDVEQQQQPGDSEVGGVPWYRRYQLERRHTTCNTLDLSSAVDGAVAAVDREFAVVEEQGGIEMADALAACEQQHASSSILPFQPHHRRSSSDSSNCSGLEDNTSPVAVTVLPTGPLHRLSCCSSASKKQPVDVVTSAAADAADAATAATVCASRSSSVEAGQNSCEPRMGEVSPWSQNGLRSHSIW